MLLSVCCSFLCGQLGMHAVRVGQDCDSIAHFFRLCMHCVPSAYVRLLAPDT